MKHTKDGKKPESKQKKFIKKSSEIKKRINKALLFSKVTHKSTHKFREFKAEDATNLTPNNRGIDVYSELLGQESIPATLQKISSELNKKLTILDAGCGIGEAIDQLLSDSSLNSIIQSVTGVSLHYFSNIEKVMSNHSGRFKFYLGKVQDVIAKSFVKFDVIFDVCGAGLYAENRIDLLKQYHQILNPGGKAYIIMGRFGDTIQDSKTNRLETLPNHFKKFYSENTIKVKKINYSGTVYPVYEIQKRSVRCEVKKYQVQSLTDCATIAKKGRTVEELKKGNAIASHVVYSINETPEPKLRLLPFSK